jgi:D-amino-acid oxidase
MSLPKKHIIVLGAGVSGLQTALSILSAFQKYKVTIIALHFPGDKSVDYTSPWAGGDWRSATDIPEVRGFDKRTYEYWRSLLSSSSSSEYEKKVQKFGIGMKPLLYFCGKETDETKGHDGSGLWFKDLVDDFEVLDLSTYPEVPKSGGLVLGVKWKTVFINIPRYLEYLFESVKDLGAEIIKASIPLDPTSGLEGIVKKAKSLLEKEDQEVFALINCTGLSARHFVGTEEAEKLYPIRGQTILVKGEAVHGRTLTNGLHTDVEELLYVIPRPGSGTTILGGCKQAGNWNAGVDKELSKRILEGVKNEGLGEELRTGEGGEFEIISEQVGLRPGRKGGPRVELEGKEKVEGTWVVHAYGHAGAGYQNSVGSAEKVVRILEGLE